MPDYNSYSNIIGLIVDLLHHECQQPRCERALRTLTALRCLYGRLAPTTAAVIKRQAQDWYRFKGEGLDRVLNKAATRQHSPLGFARLNIGAERTIALLEMNRPALLANAVTGKLGAGGFIETHADH